MDRSNPIDNVPVILVVCHEDTLRHGLEQTLTADGYEVLLARNSLEALLVGADYPDHIDALIVNIDLGAFQNSVELASCFNVLRPATRILFTSALKLPDHPIPLEAVMQGPVSFLQSPYSAAGLLDCLENLLQENPAPSEAESLAHSLS